MFACGKTSRLLTGKTLSVALLLVIATSCAPNEKVATEATTNETVVSSTPPFQTKEPERYRATRTITTVTGTTDKTITTNTIVRDGERRRDETEMWQRRVVYLYLPEGKFLLVPDEKLLVDLTKMDNAEPPGLDDTSESSPDRLLHTEPIATTYQRLGAETINGRTAQKYRVVVNGSTGTNVSVNETLIWIDDALHMPIRSETTSSDGKRVTMELSGISLDVDGSVFQIPQDYEKIAMRELLERFKVSE